MNELSLETVAECLATSPRAVKRLVKMGKLEAVFPKTGKRGHPAMMITASSYGRYLLTKSEREVNRV